MFWKENKCSLCEQKINKSPSCTFDYIIDSDERVYKRIPALESCPECEVKKEGIHHLACKKEQCPVCGFSLVSKRCPEYWDDFANSKNMKNKLTKYAYSISTRKFIIFSVISFGIYPFYWMYRTWTFLIKQENLKINPAIVALLWPLYLFPFAHKIKALSRSFYYYHVSAVAVPMLVLFIYFNWLFDYGGIFIIPFSFFPLLNLHAGMENIYRRMFPDIFVLK